MKLRRRVLVLLILRLPWFCLICVSGQDGDAGRGCGQPTVVIFRSLNRLISEFQDHWVHILLTGPLTQVQIGSPQHPVSISHVAAEPYQIPSRHMLVQMVPRLFSVVMAQYEEPAYKVLNLAMDARSLKDCIGRLQPNSICF